jgi:hypothetical protein
MLLDCADANTDRSVGMCKIVACPRLEVKNFDLWRKYGEGYGLVL